MVEVVDDVEQALAHQLVGDLLGSPHDFKRGRLIVAGHRIEGPVQLFQGAVHVRTIVQ
ncbi:hypothetical protein D3C77_802080 [compost metagenome]